MLIKVTFAVHCVLYLTVGQCKAADSYVDQLEDCLIHSCGSKVAGFIAEHIQVNIKTNML